MKENEMKEDTSLNEMREIGTYTRQVDTFIIQNNTTVNGAIYTRRKEFDRVTSKAASNYINVIGT